MKRVGLFLASLILFSVIFGFVVSGADNNVRGAWVPGEICMDGYNGIKPTTGPLNCFDSLGSSRCINNICVEGVYKPSKGLKISAIIDSTELVDNRKVEVNNPTRFVFDVWNDGDNSVSSIEMHIDLPNVSSALFIPQQSTCTDSTILGANQDLSLGCQYVYDFTFYSTGFRNKDIIIPLYVGNEIIKPSVYNPIETTNFINLTVPVYDQNGSTYKICRQFFQSRTDVTDDSTTQCTFHESFAAKLNSDYTTNIADIILARSFFNWVSMLFGYDYTCIETLEIGCSSSNPSCPLGSVEVSPCD